MLSLGRPCRPQLLEVRFREEKFQIDCSVCSREGVDQYVPTLLHMNVISAIPRNSYMLFKNLKFYLNLVQNLLDLEIARNSRRELLISSSSILYCESLSRLFCFVLNAHKVRASSTAETHTGGVQ